LGTCQDPALAEFAELEAEAEQLAREIEGLTGAEDPFRE
jgi:hypothetical protein